MHNFDSIRYVLYSIYAMVGHGANGFDSENSRSTRTRASACPAVRVANKRARRFCAARCACCKHTGFSDLTIEAIAADAEVGKATVYRWWPNKGALVVDAFASSAERKLHFPDTGSVYRDMSLQMNKCLDFSQSSRRDRGRVYWEPDNPIPNCSRRFARGSYGRDRQEAYRTLRRGIERGELPRDLDLDLTLDILYGAIYMRFLIRHDDPERSLCRGGLSHGFERRGNVSEIR